MNNHKKSIKLIKNSDFSVKKLKTFNGHEGVGANAEIWFKRKKVADFIDEGNGGEPYVYYVDENKFLLLEFIETLPEYSQAEEYSDSDYDWDEERKPWAANDVINAIVHVAEERKEFKKTLRKVVGLKNGEILTWKYKSSELDKELNHKGKLIPLHECLKLTGVKCLNLLPEDEAFELLRKHG